MGQPGQHAHVAERYTRYVEVVVIERSWKFESSHVHGPGEAPDLYCYGTQEQGLSGSPKVLTTVNL